MNGTRAQADALVDGVVRGVAHLENVEIVLCPPFIFIPLVAEKLARVSGLGFGGQNLDTHPSGAYTGEISGPMLRDFGCRYVIVGHSERRTLYGETDAVVSEKFAAAQTAGLTPIACVGETLEEREQNRTERVIERQLQALIERNGVQAFTRAVIAYEPVWAIGTGRTASPMQAQEVHRFIRSKIAAAAPSVAAELRVLYGGSVKASNAAELFGQEDIDGGLIGGASLQAEEFVAICRAA